MKWLSTLICISLIFHSSYSQSGIQVFTSAGGSTEPSAILDIQSTDKGVLIPRMSASERAGIQNPADGLMVFQTDGAAGFYFCQNQSWEKVQDESESVPIGMVIEWWRPDSNFPIPEGYAICDGSTVSDPSSPFNGIQLPNLIDGYVKGVTDPGDIGTTEEEGHQHDISFPGLYDISFTGSSHTHDFTFYLGYTSTAGNHTHTRSSFTDHTSVEDYHNHKWAAYDSGVFEFDWISHNSSGSSVVRGTWGNGMDTEGVDYFLLGVSNPGTGDVNYYTKSIGHSHNITFPEVTSGSSGSHSHSMIDPDNSSNFYYAKPAVSIENSYHNHSISLSDATSMSSTDVEPPFYGLLKIIRIK